jgi:hypothetical protein
VKPRVTLKDKLNQVLLQQVLRYVVDQLKETPMIEFLKGKKTIIVGCAMVLAAGLEMVGIDLPFVEAADAGRMLAEGFGLIFLRQGIAKLAA